MAVPHRQNKAPQHPPVTTCVGGDGDKDERAPAAPSTSRRPRTLIVGLGNDLLTDDGVGVHVARFLKQSRLGPGVRAIEVGTAVLDALHLFERADCIIAIDAMQAGGTPGTVYRLSARDISLRERVSMHDFTFSSALTLLRKQPVEVAVIGVEPERIDYGLELTSKVRQALPTAAQAVKSVIEEWKRVSAMA